MGAGEVGFHLARTLSSSGHDVAVIDIDDSKRERVEGLDVAFVLGNGALVPTLEAAAVDDCELFLAVSSVDEANLAASILAKRLGARRSVVRVGVAEDVTTYRRIYEDVFGADLLLSTQLLATTRILNHLLGHNTLAVEYLARGKVQLRKIHLPEGSLLTRHRLRDLRMPVGSLVVAFFRGDELIVPSGQDQAEPGDDALIVCRTDVIDRVERMVATSSQASGTVVIAGGGATAQTVVSALGNQIDRIRIIERNRARAFELAQTFPHCEVLHGDATDTSLLRSERVGESRAFVALSGHDERNLMASLLAQELGVPTVVALVERSEMSQLWRKLGPVRIVSPRQLAHDRIQEWVASDYASNIVSLRRGQAQVLERRLAPASPAAGVTLADINPPRGLIVGAVVRGDKVFVPRGPDRLEVGDTVVLFLQEEHLPIVRLLFPGPEPAAH